MKHAFILLAGALLISITTWGQIAGRYSKADALCSTTIILFPNGIYNIESGCENHSSFAMGSWTKKKDTILFHELDSSFSVIRNVVASNTGTPQITVQLFDTAGNNITARYPVGQLLEGMGVYNIDLDSTQTIRKDFKRKGSVIVITKLERLLGRPVRVNTDNANAFKIYLDPLLDYVRYENSHWFSRGHFKLLYVKNKLMSLHPETDFLTAQDVITVYNKEQ
ncbi:MAG: hypothetical protein J7623_28790 [Chitinophaga sp.]|uniref:hypothetical protein n=1 Tax=Chitinophaga sp. TaxID=1869181 RepID=UPI001B0E5756|nr:hypothetical protein [Chitinophaga sp.]MBO9732675.1 hypothetical protein [Chitinophaga sp.]